MDKIWGNWGEIGGGNWGQRMPEEMGKLEEIGKKLGSTHAGGNGEIGRNWGQRMPEEMGKWGRESGVNACRKVGSTHAGVYLFNI